MEKKQARYIDIAIDIAQKIKTRHYKEGEKLRGRSLSAAQYGVSAETIRKSFILLQENKVISIKEKSGAVVISREQAVQFVRKNRKKSKIDYEYNTLQNLMKSKKELDLDIQHSLKKILRLANERIVRMPIDYIELLIHDEYICVGKTLDEMNFYNVTGATLFGIVSGDKVISSILKNYVIKAGDVLFFSGETENFNQVIKLVKSI